MVSYLDMEVLTSGHCKFFDNCVIDSCKNNFFLLILLSIFSYRYTSFVSC